jgi:hypothetical protein
LIEENEIRTAGLGRGVEYGCNSRVHLDGQAPIHHELLVPDIDLGLDPVREDILED